MCYVYKTKHSCLVFDNTDSAYLLLRQCLPGASISVCGGRVLTHPTPSLQQEEGPGGKMWRGRPGGAASCHLLAVLPGATQERIPREAGICLAVGGVGIHSANYRLCSCSHLRMCSNPCTRSLLRTRDTPARRLTQTAASHPCPRSTSLTSSNSSGALSPAPLPSALRPCPQLSLVLSVSCGCCEYSVTQATTGSVAACTCVALARFWRT